MYRRIRFYTSVCLLWATLAALWIGSLIFGALPLYAHGGGAPQLAGEVAGPYRIFVWSQPEPLRVGDIHLSIGVVKAGTGSGQSADALDEPVTDATVIVSLLPVTQDVLPISVPAVLQEQLGSYYYEADATLPTVGEWHFTIEVSGVMGVGSASFVDEAFPAREMNWFLLGAAGVLLPFLLGLGGLWSRLQAKETLP